MYLSSALLEDPCGIRQNIQFHAVYKFFGPLSKCEVTPSPFIQLFGITAFEAFYITVVLPVKHVFTDRNNKSQLILARLLFIHINPHLLAHHAGSSAQPLRDRKEENPNFIASIEGEVLKQQYVTFDISAEKQRREVWLKEPNVLERLEGFMHQISKNQGPRIMKLQCLQMLAFGHKDEDMKYHNC